MAVNIPYHCDYDGYLASAKQALGKFMLLIIVIVGMPKNIDKDACDWHNHEIMKSFSYDYDSVCDYAYVVNTKPSLHSHNHHHDDVCSFFVFWPMDIVV